MGKNIKYSNKEVRFKPLTKITYLNYLEMLNGLVKHIWNINYWLQKTTEISPRSNKE